MGSFFVFGGIRGVAVVGWMRDGGCGNGGCLGGLVGWYGNMGGKGFGVGCGY